MLGQQYFEKRLGDTYNFCLVKYLNGSGEIVSDNKRSNVNWELCQDITGEVLFILSSSAVIETDENDGFKNYSIVGLSSDGTLELKCERFVIYSQKMGWRFNNERFTYFCSLYDLISIKNRDKYRENNFSKALAYLTNFKFEGLEFSKYDNLDKKDKFCCKLQDRTAYFKLLFNDKDIKELMEIGRINKAVFSTLEYPLKEGESIDYCLGEIEKICWFLCVSTFNTNFSPLVQVYSEDQIVVTIIRSILILPHHGNVMIDNFHIKAGIPDFFSQCYQNYNLLQNNFDFNQFISLLLDLQNQHHIELQIATLLLAYENLLSQYLIYRGIPQAEIEEGNVELKIRKFNTIFRFIRKDLLGDDLRASIRNPLFHLGNIPFLTIKEKIDAFEKYYELLIQITLKILDYHGEYTNRLNYTNSRI
jgi:hypothetical protein